MTDAELNPDREKIQEAIIRMDERAKTIAECREAVERVMAESVSGARDRVLADRALKALDNLPDR